ncbi:unnamed protein product [Closterium sp. NIES-64]|nr:unnamed protein product [Closterium sp. NIES-64]
MTLTTRGKQGVVRILLFWPNIIGYLRIALLLTLLLYLPLSAPHPINLSTLSASSSLPSIAHAHASVYPRAHASPFATHAMPVLLCALLYLLNMALDGVDGVVARRLRQVSAFGAILDVAVDNALRTAMWAAAVNSAMLTMNSVRLGMNSAGGSVLGINSARMLQAAAIIIPCVEWFTFACSHASTLGSASGSGSGSATRAHGNDTTALAEGAKGGVGVARQEQEQGVGEGQEHDSRGKGVEQGAGLKMRSKERSNWKDVWGGKNDSPLLVSLVMRNGFKTPVGVMAIAGLHFLPLWLFLRHHLHFFLTSLSHAYLQSEGKLESAPKFDGSDYWTWSFRFEQWAEAHDLWGYFDGSEERPASGDARLKWERKNQKAFAQFCNALVPDELIRLVREFGGKTELGSAPVDGGARAVTRIPAGTAAAYIRVKEFYLQRGLCNRMALSEELSSLKMKEGEGVAAYWARAEDLRSKYLAAGGKEEVEEWMMRVLIGLPLHFEMLKVVLNNQSSSLTKDQLLTSLRSEEMRIGVAPRSDGVATFGAAGGGRGSNGKAQVADEEEQDDKAEAVVGEAVAAVGEEQPREGWWIDSGASHNFTPYASDFKSKLQPPEVRGVRLGDGRVVKAVGMGEVPVVGAGGQLLRIQKVHLVPEMHTRLLSVPHLTSRDVIVTFKGKRCVLQRGERVLAIGEKERGRDHGLVRMFLPLAQGTQGSALAAKSSSSFSPLTLAHRRLGHTAPTTLQQMARGNSVLGFEIGGGNTDCSPCEPCLLGKSARKPFPHEASRALGPLDEVHMDLWGPVRTPSLGGAVYVLSLIDNFTRRVWSFPLPNKESAIVAKVLRQCHKDVELECGRKLKAVRSDRGGEFLGEAVKAWKAEFGIKTQLSVADTPQQNGVVERWHRTMAEGIRTLLVDSGLPARLWGEALMWVVWVKNRVTHSALPASITPMEAWSGQKPHVGMARIWGCMGSVMLHGHEKGGKLDARAVMCVCVGVDMESKGWRMLDPSIMRIRIARDVDFLENVMWKDWDKAKEFGELLQDAAAISQLLPLPLSPPSATADDVEMPLSPLPPAPLSVSVQQQPTPLQQLSGPSVIQRRSATQATSSSSSSSQRSIPLSTGAPPSPATTSPPPVTGLQALGIQSGTGGEEVGGDAGVVEGMLCLAREVEGVALAGVSTGDVPRTLAEALRGPEGPAWKAGAEKEVKEVLAQRYQMKDLGDLSMYLGVEVRRSVKDGWLEIGQEKYVRGL